MFNGICKLFLFLFTSPFILLLIVQFYPQQIDFSLINIAFSLKWNQNDNELTKNWWTVQAISSFQMPQLSTFVTAFSVLMFG